MNITWKKRREELVELFRKEEYGRMPEGFTCDGKLIRERQEDWYEQRTYEVCVKYGGNEYQFPFSLWLPANAKKPVPVTILVCNHSREEKESVTANPEVMEKMLPVIKELLGSEERFQAMCEDQFSEKKVQEKHAIDIEHDMDQGYWPVKKLLERGWGAAAFYTDDVAPDDAILWNKTGMATLFSKDCPKPDSFGCLSLWAFGASRVLDVLLSVPEVDENRISVAGHSRGGKTALWAAAQDERFETAFVNNSGCCGAAQNEGKYGENVNSILLCFGYWFCENFKEYMDVPVEDMPFDQHQLIAAMAPRPVYVASGSIDYWSDPEAEFASGKKASAVWEELGLLGLVCETYPEPESVWHDGMIGYHLRDGGHALTESDWMRFCDFEEKTNKR